MLLFMSMIALTTIVNLLPSSLQLPAPILGGLSNPSEESCLCIPPPIPLGVPLRVSFECGPPMLPTLKLILMDKHVTRG